MVAFNINCCALDAYWGFYVLHTVIAYFTAEDWVCTSTEVCVSDMNLVKVFPQLMHWYGFSPVCVLKWFTRRLFIKKHFMHWIYLYCFSQECFPRSMKKILPHEKALSHWMQAYGLSPVCFLICIIRLLSERILIQWLHWSMWVLRCITSLTMPSNNYSTIRFLSNCPIISYWFTVTSKYIFITFPIITSLKCKYIFWWDF